MPKIIIIKYARAAVLAMLNDALNLPAWLGRLYLRNPATVEKSMV